MSTVHLRHKHQYVCIISELCNLVLAKHTLFGYVHRFVSFFILFLFFRANDCINRSMNKERLLFLQWEPHKIHTIITLKIRSQFSGVMFVCAGYIFKLIEKMSAICCRSKLICRLRSIFFFHLICDFFLSESINVSSLQMLSKLLIVKMTHLWWCQITKSWISTVDWGLLYNSISCFTIA